MKTNEEFVITRTFNAPRELVFNAFANEEALSKWWGPAGMQLIVLRLNFEPKGTFHYKMEANGHAMYGIFHYKNIEPTHLIEYVSSFSNENGDITKAPFDIDFPLELFNQVTLTENNGKTILRLQGYPVNASKEQEAVYVSMFASMQQGFGGTFDKLEKYLSSVNNN